MKFTEGYWEQSERANGIFPMMVYRVEKLPYGMRVTAPCKIITGRGNAMNTPVLTIDFLAVAKNVIEVQVRHFEGEELKEPRFERMIDPQPIRLEITEEEAVLQNGKLFVRINRKNWGYQFEAEGRILTTSGTKNLGYMRMNREPSTFQSNKAYLREQYEPYMMTELSLQPGECVYGLGERFTAFVKNGQRVDMWNEDGGTSSYVSYKNIPFYLTNKGYGVFVDHADRVSFEVASEKVSNVGISVPGESLRYCLIYGETPKEILKTYGDLLGKPALPPAWSFGLWLSTSFATDYDEDTVSEMLEQMESEKIPLSVFHFDCFWMKAFQWCGFEWDDRVFPNPKQMLQGYKQRGLKICVWINPYIAQGTTLFREGMERGYFLKREDGRGIRQMDRWQPGMAFVDFTNPEAYNWYQEKLKQLLELGVDAFKTDFGERIPIDVRYADGSKPEAMHNYYSYLYNQCVFELLKKEKGEQEAVVFARSATAGGQKYPVHWGGDCSANYASMAETIRGGLSLAMCGFAFWSHDISGFEQTATPDLYKRWTAFGMLSTHSRLHGSKSYRVPWVFDREAVEVLQFFTRLKCRLMPYIYAKAVEAHKTGIPVMRPMILEFPEDPAVRYLDTQYMFGESLLVAPILNTDSIGEYYLPNGTWIHLLSGERKTGGAWYRESYSYFSLPLYVRENTLLAIGNRDDSPEYDYADQIEIHVYQLQEKANVLCRLVDCKGNQINEIRAVKTGEWVILTADTVEKGLVYVLHQDSSIKEIQNGRLEMQKSECMGSRVLPLGTEVRIRFAKESEEELL